MFWLQSPKQFLQSECAGSAVVFEICLGISKILRILGSRWKIRILEEKLLADQWILPNLSLGASPLIIFLAGELLFLASLTKTRNRSKQTQKCLNKATLHSDFSRKTFIGEKHFCGSECSNCISDNDWLVVSTDESLGRETFHVFVSLLKRETKEISLSITQPLFHLFISLIYWLFVRTWHRSLCGSIAGKQAICAKLFSFN